MKRGIFILLSLTVLVAVAHFTASKWAIRHETIAFHDSARDNRLVTVNIAVRRDSEMQANAGLIKLPVAILNGDSAAKNADYLFLADTLARRGYLTISPQHDLPTDPQMVTKVGEPYVGRLPQLQRGVTNIRFALEEMKKVQPNAEYDKVTLVGHSAGGDIAMYFAKQYPDEVTKVVTLDNMNVPLLTSGKFKILSFRSKDNQLKPDPGIVPDAEQAEKAGITVVTTGFQHNDMRDTGADVSKDSIKSALDKFLAEVDANPEKKVITEVACQEKSRKLGVVSSGPCVDVGDIVDNLLKGEYIFNKPSSAYIGEPLKFRLVLTTSNKQSANDAFSGLPGTITKVEGQFAQSIEATLRGDDLEIKPGGPQPRTATTSKSVEWDWTVIPQSGGKKILTIEVAANIQVGPEHHRVQVKTLDHEMIIQVSPLQQLKLYISQANGFFVATAAAIAPLAVLVGYLPKVRTFFSNIWRRMRRKPLPNRAARRANGR